jgi:hypothetical protein
MRSELAPRRSLVLGFVLGLVVICFATTQAKATSVAYNVGGTFASGSYSQYFGGQLTWDNSSNKVTAYTLNLGSTVLTCSGSCTAVFKTFSGPGYVGVLAGAFNPFLSPFTLSMVNSSGAYFMATNMSWSYASVPEGSAIAQLLCVLVLLAFMIPRSPLLKRATAS